MASSERQSAFTSLEEEYSVAGWFGLFEVMNLIGSENISLKDFPIDYTERALLDLCRDVSKRESSLKEIIEYIVACKNEPRIMMLERMAILDQSYTSAEFDNAHDMYYHPDFLAWLESTDFERLLPLIDELSSHFATKILRGLSKSASLVLMLDLTRRDIEFYSGFYDSPPQDIAVL